MIQVEIGVISSVSFLLLSLSFSFNCHSRTCTGTLDELKREVTDDDDIPLAKKLKHMKDTLEDDDDVPLSQKAKVVIFLSSLFLIFSK